MSLWWAKREQLDEYQVSLIESLDLDGEYLVLGPPGSGKTNVLLRRAQFYRLQRRPNVQVLTFTRALAEFIKTGCYDAAGREIFPETLINTFEGWIRWLYSEHEVDLPNSVEDLREWKRQLASGALDFAALNRIPRYDAIFVDEAQDLITEEVSLLRAFSPNIFFVGDDRQKIYDHGGGLAAIRSGERRPREEILPFHYRLVEEICHAADRIQVTANGTKLSDTSHYDGPRPGRITTSGPLGRAEQISLAAITLQEQLRAYSDLIEKGDRLGIIVPRSASRDEVFEALERIPALAGKSQIIRARTGDDHDSGYDPSFSDQCPISIVTLHGSKGLEFRAVHWLFVDELANRFALEHYYTGVTRAKTSLDIYFTESLPQVLARSCVPPSNTPMW